MSLLWRLTTNKSKKWAQWIDWDHTVKFHPLYGCVSESVAQNTWSALQVFVSLGPGRLQDSIKVPPDHYERKHREQPCQGVSPKWTSIASLSSPASSLYSIIIITLIITYHSAENCYMICTLHTCGNTPTAGTWAYSKKNKKQKKKKPEKGSEANPLKDRK